MDNAAKSAITIIPCNLSATCLSSSSDKNKREGHLRATAIQTYSFAAKGILAKDLADRFTRQHLTKTRGSAKSILDGLPVGVDWNSTTTTPPQLSWAHFKDTLEMMNTVDELRKKMRSTERRVVRELLRDGWGHCKPSFRSATASTKTRLQEIIDSETGQADDRSLMTAD